MALAPDGWWFPVTGEVEYSTPVVPVGVVTTVTFPDLGRHGRRVLEVDGELGAFDVMDAVTEFLAPLAGGRPLDVVVELPSGAHTGRVILTLDQRRAGEGLIEIRVPEAPPVAYPDGRVVCLGDVVRVGGYGSAFHEVVDVQIGLVRIRATQGRPVAQTVAPGRLVLVERRGGAR